MARCRTLIKENDELAKSIDQSQLSRLDAQLAIAVKELTTAKSAQSGTIFVNRFVFTHFYVQRLMNFFSNKTPIWKVCKQRLCNYISKSKYSPRKMID